ncbi:MAG: xanthine dehydrogenase family protein molybdopterin-binding subunit [Phycisphaerales bacterium]|nr:xanthine dehydrogenase family protein molybdopterin-binding subunit [Phycisphaerales bacterium]
MKPLDEATLIPSHMPTTNRPSNMGASVNDNASRLDAVPKVTGSAKYGKDYHLPNSLYIVFIRCPWGAADFVSADEAAAKATPGVVEMQVRGKSCTYHGQSIGYIAADSPRAAKRALRALAPKWKRTPVKTQISDTVKDNPDIGDDGQNNMNGAEVTHEAVYTTPVQTHSSLETHGGAVDHRGDRATVYASTQGTSSSRDGLGGPLGLGQGDFELVCEYVGGGFGSKLGGPGKELTTAAQLAAKYKRPAYMFCNRSEEHLDTGNRPSSRTLARIGFKKDGSPVGGEIRTWGGTGVAGGGGGASIPSGRYKLGEIKKLHDDVSFNGGGPRAFRAPGHPQAAFAEELMLDEVAAKLGMDPLALRMKLAGGEHRKMFEAGAKLIGWSNRKPNGSQNSALRTGYGAGAAGWGSAGPGGAAEVVIARDGSVESRTGTQDIGTGQRTGMGIVTADALGIPLKYVSVKIGRSTLPPGPGSGGSVTTPTTAPTMTAVAKAAKTQLLELLATQANAKPDEFSIKDGVVLRNGEKYLTWEEACGKLPNDGITANKGKGERGDGHSNGVQFVKLDVDTETGVIHLRHVVAIQSCGRVICRKTAESQIIGGVIQGLSFALFENKLLDRNTGAMVNDNFESYKILGPGDMPHIEPVLWSKGQSGFKALGEPPTIPTAGATACALFNAIGRPVRDLPLTPDKVLAALAAGQGGAA